MNTIADLGKQDAILGWLNEQTLSRKTSKALFWMLLYPIFHSHCIVLCIPTVVLIPAFLDRDVRRSLTGGGLKAYE